MSYQPFRDLFWFIRPTLGVVICYSVAIGISYRMSQRGIDHLDDQLDEVGRLADEIAELKQPEPGLLPKEVVEIQVSAMADKDQRRGALQCASFASPENFAVTGPLDRFARMLRDPKFLILSSPDTVVVGDTIFQDENARVLVTVLSGERTRAFVWVLSKQSGAGPWNGCWMTDGVFPMRLEDRWNDSSI